MIHYLYKITNTINGKWYIGVHSAESLDDGYFGSGIAIKRAIKKYGKDSFIKEVLETFSSKEDMFIREAELVTTDTVNDRSSYNMKVGGFGGWPQSKEQSQKVGRSLQALYQAHPELRALKSEQTKRFWADDKYRERWMSKNKERIEKLKVTNAKEETRKKRSLATAKRMADPENRKRISITLLNNKEYHASMKEMGARQTGYDNPEFVHKYKEIYEQDMLEISRYLTQTNLPDSFIVEDLFHKKVKTVKLIAYYEHIGILPKPLHKERKPRFLSFINEAHSHLDGASVKTWYSEVPEVKICFLFEDLLQLIPEILRLNEALTVSDAMVARGKGFPAKIITTWDYLEDLGILTREIKTISIPTMRAGKSLKADGSQITIRSKKTFVNIKYENLSCVLVDKEFNRYEFDLNGSLIQKGKFAL